MLTEESLARLLDEGRRKIQVTDEELAEAKRRDVHKRLRTAKEHIDLAIEHERAGRRLSAQHALHQVPPQLVAKPNDAPSPPPSCGSSSR